MANPKLVPRTPTSFSESSNHFAIKERLTKGSSKPTSSSYPKANNAMNSVGCLRKCLAGEGISERASGLIVSLTRGGTVSTYSSAWNKWVSWCVEQNFDPVQCNVNWILDFLAFIFESGYEYRTIWPHRSAISALHNNVEGRPVGDHPQVSSLITGVFNNWPSQPKYNFIWNVQLVLDYLKKELPANSNLSDKLLGLKIAVLDRTAIIWNKILELLIGEKCLQSNSDFMNKILHEKHSYVTCIFSFVKIRLINVGRGFTVIEDKL